MKDTSSKALESLARGAQQQAELLVDAHLRPEVNLAAVQAVALEALLRLLRSELSQVRDAATLPEETREAAREAVAALEAHARGTVQLRSYLSDLSSDWECPHCKKDVAGGARVLASGKVELVCAACKKASPLTAEGEKVFQRRFGHLVVEGWQPERNGFLPR